MENRKSASTGLIISTQKEKILSKQQQAFNRFIKRIEKLRLDLVREQKSLDAKLEYYVKFIHPIKKQLTELSKETVKLLFTYFNNKRILQQKQRMSLGGLIAGMLDDIFQSEQEEPEEALKKIFKAVEGITYEKAVEEDFEIMKENLGSMFDEFGFNMNFDNLHSKMTPEEMMQKAIEMQEQLKQQASEKEKQQTARKKTKKQLEQEEKARQVEEARTKNISTIYKQLAKILHPDLEQDETLKLQKEELMKQLTNAYENNDLHTLLNLELTWIKNEDNSPGKLSDDKLDIYNEVLKEQIYELEGELNAILEHPRYQPLQKFVMFPDQIKTVNLKQEKQELESEVQRTASQNLIINGQDKMGITTVKRMIRIFEEQRKYGINFPF